MKEYQLGFYVFLVLVLLSEKNFKNAGLMPTLTSVLSHLSKRALSLHTKDKCNLIIIYQFKLNKSKDTLSTS